MGQALNLRFVGRGAGKGAGTDGGEGIRGAGWRCHGIQTLLETQMPALFVDIKNIKECSTYEVEHCYSRRNGLISSISISFKYEAIFLS